RIFLALSRDRLLPQSLAAVHPKTQTPVRIIVFVGIIMSIVSGLVPIQNLAELVNIGTLSAFVVVCAGVIIMRRTKRDMPRPFRNPLSPLIPILGIIFCLYLMISLPKLAWIAFTIWTTTGFFIYFLYSRKRSILSKQKVMAQAGYE